MTSTSASPNAENNNHHEDSSETSCPGSPTHPVTEDVQEDSMEADHEEVSDTTTTVTNGVVKDQVKTESSASETQRKESSSSAMSPPIVETKLDLEVKSKPLRLRRVNHSSELVAGLKDLLNNESLTDVLLSCSGGVNIKAHRVILSTFSPYFKSIFEGHPFSESPWTFPVVVLKEYGAQEVKTIVDFIYKGEVSVSRERLPLVLSTARALEVSGLADLNGETFSSGKISSDTQRKSSSPMASPTQTNASLNALRSFHGSLNASSTAVKRSFPVSPLQETNQDNEQDLSVMAKRLRTCLQSDNRNGSPTNRLDNQVLNLSSNRHSPIQQQDYLSGRLPASILGQLVQHQMMKKASEQQQLNKVNNNNNSQRSMNATNNNLKQQILQQQLLRSKNPIMNTQSNNSSSINSGNHSNNSRNYSLTEQFQARLRQQMQERHALNNPNSFQTEQDHSEEDKESVFHRQQQLRLQQLQKQQHQYALQMQLEETTQEDKNSDFDQNEDSMNDVNDGFDWQEGFTDEQYSSKQLQIANINSNNNSGVSTPDFLQPRGPGRPRKGNKAQEISPCPECNKVFVRPDVLKLHYRSVHLNERHPCNLCPKIFKWPGDLSKHKRTKHPDKYPAISAQ